MNRYRNTQKTSFLASIPTASIDADVDELTTKCKFNFAYFDHQPAGQSFSDWTDVQLKKLLAKLQEYSKQPLQHWRDMGIGKSGSVLSIYGAFPRSSDFKHPRHVPHEVQWGRFRLEHSLRLVGFVLPPHCHDTYHKSTGVRFDCNTFYVVFLDADHRFYKTEKA
ncbi:hypothetical protein [Acidovorax sp.]|uniref:hypothetical protein n=1 Tax=Acidovorax sp. TaxID=1872122 RepID=UPI0025B7FE68|nr:hypothetical protein [Acidovorax sp.]MBW8464217.1 hypothetical protein [Acidovorax sp.]